jgi:hypothetical protein
MFVSNSRPERLLPKVHEGRQTFSKNDSGGLVWETTEEETTLMGTFAGGFPNASGCC